MNLLFDLDGTLADPFQSFYNSLTFAYKRQGQPPPSVELVRKCVGPPLQDSLVSILGFDEFTAETVLKDYRNHHAVHCIAEYTIYKGAKEALEALKPKHRLFVATSKPHTYARPIIDFHKMTSYFVKVYGSELDGVNSTKTDLIRAIMAEQNLDPKETVMIGDRKHDAIGATNNKIHSVGVLWGFGSLEELQQAGTSTQFKNWTELVAYFNR